jgi:hypothetical protein
MSMLKDFPEQLYYDRIHIHTFLTSSPIMKGGLSNHQFIYMLLCPPVITLNPLIDLDEML